jgi:hypothetical protein
MKTLASILAALAFAASILFWVLGGISDGGFVQFCAIFFAITAIREK